MIYQRTHNPGRMIELLYIGCVLTWVCFFYPNQACADTAIWQYATSRAGPVWDLVIDPATPETLYTTYEKTIFTSSDNGENWEPISLEIQDLFGHLVQSLESGVQAQGHYVLPN